MTPCRSAVGSLLQFDQRQALLSKGASPRRTWDAAAQTHRVVRMRGSVVALGVFIVVVASCGFTKTARWGERADSRLDGLPGRDHSVECLNGAADGVPDCDGHGEPSSCHCGSGGDVQGRDQTAGHPERRARHPWRRRCGRPDRRASEERTRCRSRQGSSPRGIEVLGLEMRGAVEDGSDD